MLIVSVLVACGEETPSGDDDGDGEPTSSVEPTAPAEPRGPEFLVFFHRGEKVVAVRRQAAAPTVAVAQAAMNALVAGPTAREASDGLGSEIPAGTSALGVSLDGTTATVDLSDAFDDGGGSLSMRMRAAQVVFTLTQFGTIDSVVFRMDGEPIGALGGEGLILTDSQTREDWEDLSPAVLIERPAWGDDVDGTAPIKVSGTANVFEAEFDVDLIVGGDTLTSVHVMATSGTGTRGTFETAIGLPDYAPGPARIVAWAPSPRDGSREEFGEVRVDLVGGE
jgi:hypothetical protein